MACQTDIGECLLGYWACKRMLRLHVKRNKYHLITGMTDGVQLVHLICMTIHQHPLLICLHTALQTLSHHQPRSRERNDA